MNSYNKQTRERTPGTSYRIFWIHLGILDRSPNESIRCKMIRLVKMLYSAEIQTLCISFLNIIL